ncbi:MAG TPA: hypothetical protein VMW46_12665 [Candidatus Desulfaltia sp.]|nr:hypothetical protein [Candidatus Desulfaltia sp.]
MESKMRVDNYTKFILTVIALCLVFICLQEVRLFPMLYGSTPDIVDVRIKAIERLPGQNWDSILIGIIDKLPVEVVNTAAIPVQVKNSLLPVDVKNVEVKSTLKPIEVKK